MDPRPPTTMEVLEELVNTLRASLMPVTTSQSASVCPMAMPASYAGDAAECGGFLRQLALYIEMQPAKFPTECTKLAFLISLLSGRALLWTKATLNASTAIINSYEAYTNHLKESLAPLKEHSVSDQLLRLCQGAMSIPCSFGCWRRPAGGMRQMVIYNDTVGLESFMK